MKIEDVLSIAQTYAVCPLSKHSKIPLPGSKGNAEATKDGEWIRAVHEQHQDCNWGLVPGSADVVIIDVDYKKGAPNPNPIEEKLPQTYTVTTPNGKHYYYRIPAGAPASLRRPTQSKILPYVDTRADNSHAVAPGCYVQARSQDEKSGFYVVTNDVEPVDCPEFFVQLYREREAADEAKKAAQQAKVRPISIRPVSEQVVLRAAAHYLDELPACLGGTGGQGERDFFAAARILQNGFALGESDVRVLLEDFNVAKCVPLFSPREIEHKIRQVFSKADPSGEPYGHLVQGLQQYLEEQPVPDDLDRYVAALEAEKKPAEAVKPQQAKETSVKIEYNPDNASVAKWYSRGKHKDTRYWQIVDKLAQHSEVFEAYFDWAASQCLYVHPGLILGALVAGSSVWASRWWTGATGLQAQLWALSLADTGAGKGASVQIFQRLVSGYGQGQVALERQISTKEALRKGLERCAANNFAKPLCLDEYGEFLKVLHAKNSHGLGIAKDLVEIATNNGGDMVFSTSLTANDGKEIVVSAPAVPFYAASNPTSLRQAFRSVGTDSGYLGRHVVFAAQDESLGLVDENDFHEWDAEMPALLKGALDAVAAAFTQWRREQPKSERLTRDESTVYLYRPNKMSYSDDVKVVLKRHRRAFKEDGVKTGKDKNLYVRLVEQAERMALGLAVLLNPAQPEVTTPLLNICLEIARESVHSIEATLATGTERIERDDEEEKCNRVLQALRVRSGHTTAKVSWAQLCASTRRVGNRKALLDILERLEQEGLVQRGLGVGSCLPWSLTEAALKR